ncbi:glycosyltransferase family 4 protein [Microbacterium sp. HMH0099]|uniref:glycosyltransferase family 4 protein n=1 Tax=Microbacterium sp. HMH0099 TaxID=3414026 RepID=UPI003BF6C4A9
MRLIFASSARDPWGAEQSLLRIIKGLIELGHEVHCVFPRGAAAEYVGQSTAHMVHYKPGNRLQSNFRVRQLVSNLPTPDALIVFSLDLMPLAGLYRRAPVFFDIHDTPDKLITRMTMRTLAKFYRGAISISEFASAWGIGFRKVSVVPRPIDAVAAVPMRQAAGPLRVGIVGRISPEKDIEIAIRATQAAEAELHVYGAQFGTSDAYETAMKSLAHQLGASVLWHGRRDQREVYSAIDALFVGNALEPSGRTVGEAMSYGVVPITPTTGGAPEYFTDLVEGLTYSPGDVQSAAAAIIALRDDKYRQDLATAARNRVGTERSLERVLNGYLRSVKP